MTEECKLDSRKSRKRKHGDGGELAAPSSECSQTTSLLSELFDSLCTFLRGSLSLYMQHVYASHVMREVLHTLSAQHTDDLFARGRQQLQQQRQQQQQQQGHSHTGLTSAACCYTSY